MIVTPNNGPSPRQANVTITDTLPTGAVFVDSMHPPGVTVGVSPDGTTVTASLGTIAAGDSETITLIVRPATTGAIQNSATVTAVQADGNLLNNTVVTTSNITPSADVAVTASSQPPTILLGQGVTFTFDVVNEGPSDSSGIVLTTVIPTGVSVGSVLTNMGTVTTAGQEVILTIPTLASGALATLSVTGSTTITGLLVATAAITSTSQDPFAGNDSATATADVIPAADLAISQLASANPAPCCTASLTYTIPPVTNNGPSDATNVILTDVLPAGATFISATSPDGSILTPVAGDT